MSKRVTLTIVLRGKAEDLAKRYRRVLREADQAYFTSASGKLIPVDYINPRRLEELDRGA